MKHWPVLFSLRSIVPAVLAFAMSIVPMSAKIYKGAEYRTKASYLYGRFETRMRSINRDGMLASFFTYNDSYPSTAWNEIDIEIMGRYSDDVQFNTITPGQANHVRHHFVPFDPSAEYHTYGFEWTPDYVAWLIDGTEVYRQTGAHIATLNIAQKIMMNVWLPVSADWAGKFNEGSLPAFASYDWVQYASYTPGTGTMGSGNNFSPQWKDEFATWDQARWDKASHTWNENNVDFVYDNAVVQNGSLTLCLTKETALGLTDGVAPAPLWARGEGNTMRVCFSEDLDPTSAETAANYSIPNLTVQSAQLLPDRRTVLLSVPGLTDLSSTNIIAQNIADRWSPPNVAGPKAVSMIKQVPLTFPLKINVAGESAGSFVRDTTWSERTEYGHVEGWTSYHSGVSIANTTDPEVFRSEQTNIAKYRIRVPNGNYFVTLQFAENYFTQAGQRVFDVFVEGTLAESNLDIYAQVGIRKAYQKSVVSVPVSDGVLDIHFAAEVEHPLLNGISIVQIGTSVNELIPSIPTEDALAVQSNYPNPFNGASTILFRVRESEQLRLKVYDTLGRIVTHRDLGLRSAGLGSISWDATDDAGRALPSGVYFCQLEGVTSSRPYKLVYTK